MSNCVKPFLHDHEICAFISDPAIFANLLDDFENDLAPASSFGLKAGENFQAAA